jgi:hypothetical protein
MDKRPHGESNITSVSAALKNDMDSWLNRSGVYDSCGWDGPNGTSGSQEWDAGARGTNLSDPNSDGVESWRTRGGC